MDYSFKFLDILKDSVQGYEYPNTELIIDKWKIWDVANSYIKNEDYYQCAKFIETSSYIELDYYSCNRGSIYAWSLWHLVFSCMYYRKLGHKKYSSLLAEISYQKIKDKIYPNEYWDKEDFSQYPLNDIVETMALADLCMFFDKELAFLYYDNLKKIQRKTSHENKYYFMSTLGIIYGYDGAQQQFRDLLKTSFDINYDSCPYLDEEMDNRIAVLNEVIENTENVEEYVPSLKRVQQLDIIHDDCEENQIKDLGDNIDHQEDKTLENVMMYETLISLLRETGFFGQDEQAFEFWEQNVDTNNKVNSYVVKTIGSKYLVTFGEQEIQITEIKSIDFTLTDKSLTISKETFEAMIQNRTI